MCEHRFGVRGRLGDAGAQQEAAQDRAERDHPAEIQKATV